MATETWQSFTQALLGVEHRAYGLIARYDPEYFEALKHLYADATFARSDSALPRETKELIMVGICCALNRQRGIRVHTERALELGARPRQVLEAMETAAIPGGMPGLWAGVEILDEILRERDREFD